MRFTDIFIRKPVLATVVSLLIFILGLISYNHLDLREFPDVNLSNITVQSSFSGATPEAMQTLVTSYIESAVATVDGIDYVEASNGNGSSTVTVHLIPGVDVDSIMVQIGTAIQQTAGNLPTTAAFTAPIINKVSADSSTLMVLGFYSDKMSIEQMTDYLNRVTTTQLQAIPGVASASVSAGRNYAMRLWLDPKLMSSKNISGDDINAAVSSGNVTASTGYLEGSKTQMNVQSNTGLTTVDQFNNLVIGTGANGVLTRLKDVGYAELGASNYNSSAAVNGKQGVAVQISVKAGANPLDVAKTIRKLLPEINRSLPTTMHVEVIFDQSHFIQDSVNSVTEAVIAAALIVMLIIFVSMGSLRAVAIPVIAIPLSLVGVFAMMAALGFSINILTLLAFVLAVGLVVDDAIVVSENITRHLEHGLPPMKAALLGAREIASPVITMTITLAAVFLPVGLAGGLTGVLFSEFSYTLAGAVLVSGVISLTLSPMMCSRVLSLEQLQNPFVIKVDRFFEHLKSRYQKILIAVLEARHLVNAVIVIILVSCFVLFVTSSQEIAPTEDQNVIQGVSTAPSYASPHFTYEYMVKVQHLMETIPDRENTFMYSDLNSGQFLMLLKPRSERKESLTAIHQKMNEGLNKIPGLISYVDDLPTLPGGGGVGAAFQFILTTTSGNPETLMTVGNELVERAAKSGIFTYVNNGMKIDSPVWDFTVDTDRAAQLGISNQLIVNALNDVLPASKINWFVMELNNYKVVPQLMDQYRGTPEVFNLITLPTTTASGKTVMIPLSDIMKVKRVVKPTSLTRFERLNSATIYGTMADGYSLSDGLDFMVTNAEQLMPKEMSYNLGGQLRQIAQEGHRMLFTFMFALIIIYLVLAAQFESFRDPLIVMISVPMSLFGALIPINMGFGTINLFTEIGLLTLVGLISKHGILIVQFANQLQETEGFSVRDAVVKSASLRLRPILMTTAAMIFGVVPLLFARYGLANSESDIGKVIFFGMLIGTCFTLFVVPTMYTYLARDRSVK
jgi:multidrug efflux pump